MAQGDRVAAGQTLIEFSPEKIREAGYKTITPVIVTNTSEYDEVNITSEESVRMADLLLTTI